MAAATHDGGGGIEKALHRLKSTEPPLYLSPSPDLSQSARSASQYLFSLLRPFTPKSPFSTLLTQGFDAEQIWQQIDLQSQPLISSLRLEVKNFEKNPEEIRKLFDFEKREGLGFETENVGVEERESEGLSLEGFGDEELEGFDEDEEEEDGESEEEREISEEGESEDEGGAGDGIEDKFLKIKELEEYLEDDEAREYGLEEKKKKKKGNNKVVDDDEEDDGEDDELGVLGIDDGEDDEGGKLGNIRYEDFFGGKKKNVQKKKSKRIDKYDDSDTGDEQSDDTGHDDNQKGKNLSTFEKVSEKQRSKIEEMEKANLEPKTWTMQGEVTAAKRPKNSALEVDLDFEHNVRPAPTITEEVTANIEELIQKRILEGRFDDVQRAPALPSNAPKEIKELDENRSKKGLAEIYADEYVQKTGLVSAALTFSDEQKKEATLLFKKLCLKLDALSHFHFTPKPVIEDMSIQANVPALAMEEIAPLAVSDAAMLAPEEVFTGKGDIKEEAELTQAERKRRRANKKRKFKAEAAKRTAKKPPRESTLQNHDGKEEL